MTRSLRRALVLAPLVLASALVGAWKIGPRVYNHVRLAQLAGRVMYDEKADARVLVSAARERAAREHKRVLVVLGGNWCSWCLAFDALTHEDDDIRALLERAYVVVHVDSGNNPFEKVWGEPCKKGVPVLVFLDDAGGAAYVQDSISLEALHGRILAHDPARVLAVLQAHAS